MKLFEAGNIGKLRIKNRIVMAPMGLRGLVEPDGRFSERAIDYYVARARGGCGLIVSCVAFPDQEVEPHLVSGLWSIRPRFDSFMYISRLSELADMVHHYGAKIAIQLSAGFGRNALPDFLPLGQPLAPSPLPSFWDPNIITREITVDEIGKIVKAFAVAAGTIKRAGIDAIELHGHEGYLLDQFKTALWNKRTDRYGGDLEGRLRFGLEIISAIKDVAGSDFPVIYRYGVKHYLDGGREIDEGLEIAQRLENAGVDCLHVDAGCYETWYWTHPPTYQPHGCMVDMAEVVKRVVQIPVVAVGKLGYPELAEKVLEEGKADFVALGRSLLADPDWPNKVREGRFDDIIPCISCGEGCQRRTAFEAKYVSCALNPITGMEREYAPVPAAKSKDVLVIGGGPAGLEAARVAALRGHHVRLWEMSDKLGGNLIPASIPSFKKDLRDLIAYLSTQIKKLNVTVELSKEATARLIIGAKPEVVIIATGSIHVMPQIPGIKAAIDEGSVVTAVDFLLGKKEIGESVVIAGGGSIGCEVAVHAAQMGKKVTVIEATNMLCSELHVPARMMLMKMLSDNNVITFVKSHLVEIAPEGAVVSTEGAHILLKGDSIVLALGMSPNSQLTIALEGETFQLFRIGDCDKPGRILNAIWGGFHVARLL